MIFLLHFFWKIFFVRKIILTKLKKTIEKNLFLNKKEKSMLYYNISKGFIKKFTFLQFANNFKLNFNNKI